jgi:hypothetical protein
MNNFFQYNYHINSKKIKEINKWKIKNDKNVKNKKIIKKIR